MIEASLFTLLSGSGPVAAIVGSRVYGLHAPQGDAFPCLVFQRTGELREATACGTDQLARGSFSVDAYSKHYLEAVTLAKAVRTALIDYSGLVGDTHIDRVFLDNVSDSTDPEPGLCRVSLLFTIWYTEI